jgi:hypothetical protein
MDIITKQPKLDFPYLATWYGNFENDNFDFNKIDIKDIVLISLIENKPYISFVNGNKIGYFTEKLEEYKPFPIGFELKIIQNGEKNIF